MIESIIALGLYRYINVTMFVIDQSSPELTSTSDDRPTQNRVNNWCIELIPHPTFFSFSDNQYIASQL